MKAFFLVFLISLVFYSCKNNQNSNSEKFGYTDQKLSTDDQNEAYKKMKTLCYSCHSPTAEMDMRMAPPMVAVKMHYTKKYDNQADFAEAIWKFMQAPDENKALMKGAVRKFGVMPYLPYKEEDIRAIAAYMYNNELEKPEWFDQHYKEKHGKGKMEKGKGHGMGQGNGKMKHQRKGAKEKGKAMAIATKKELGKNLMKAISEKGTAGAVDFCNVRALPITAEKEKEFNASIKRSSDKPRNPKNKADQKESEIIALYKTELQNGETPEAILEKNGGKFEFYYPITTNDMCLQCHGEVGKEVNTKTYKTIKLKYPEDLAVGYDVNQVRGVWHITFENQSTE